MPITSDLFEAYLKCPTKCFLRSLGETGTNNSYANWVRTQYLSYSAEGIKRLVKDFAEDEVITGTVDSEKARSPKWRLSIQTLARTYNRESIIHAVERLTSERGDKSESLIPIRFINTNRVHKHDKLSLAFDALALSQMLGRKISVGNIISGDNHARLTVDPGELASEVNAVTEKIDTLLSSNSPPELILNRHCPECEFKHQCRQRALEIDELSLLSGITETERNSHRSRGIFTVKQLSYTFRSRSPRKRAKNPAMPHYFALQALAIRENTVYIHGTPSFPKSETQIYLDIEGLPDNESYYLIGALVVSEGKESFHSFWADDKSEEPARFSEFVESVSQLSDFRILHFGAYDTVAMKRMKARLPELLHTKVDRILERATNVLSVIHQHIYFPVYANSLKDIGRFLGFEWTSNNATGLEAIVWRNIWNTAKASDIKTQLLQYNQDDCRALKHVVESIGRLVASNVPMAPGDGVGPVVNTSDLKQKRSDRHRFRKIDFVVPGFDVVNRSAYFDYQRQRVFARASGALRRRFAKKLRRRSRVKPNKILHLETKKCISCGSRKISQLRPVKRRSIDLKFFPGGVKKWITDYLSWNYKCTKCGSLFTPEGVPGGRAPKYGHGLATWCIYNNLVCGQNLLRVRRALIDVFDLDVPQPTIFRFKSSQREILQPVYDNILTHLLKGSLLHIDETEVKLKGRVGYVWVFASMDAVYFEYRDSRKAQFLGPLLKDFKGVLVSDFFTGYDSLDCPQQKCLIHLIRDMNEDLLRNSFDAEYKTLVEGFGHLLRQIVETVDKYGLKQRHLGKHRRDTVRLLKSVETARYSSQVATKYQERMGKYGSRLFTFLDYDGVPWNNNNAEHAIHAFARVRRFADGRFTEDSVREYLVMLSVAESCKYQNIDVLEFLLGQANKPSDCQLLLECGG
jgi:predicted RecB family nuclease